MWGFYKAGLNHGIIEMPTHITLKFEAVFGRPIFGRSCFKEHSVVSGHALQSFCRSQNCIRLR
jgi:hypothetical protein